MFHENEARSVSYTHLDVYKRQEIYGAGTRFNIPRTINEQTYAVPAPDCLTPVAPAYSAFVYNPGNYSAGIAYNCLLYTSRCV